MDLHSRPHKVMFHLIQVVFSNVTLSCTRVSLSEVSKEVSATRGLRAALTTALPELGGQTGAGKKPHEQFSCVLLSIALLAKQRKWLLLLVIFLPVLCQVHVLASPKHANDVTKL